VKIQGITAAQLRTAIETTSAELYNNNLTFNRDPEQIGSWIHFTLKINDCHGPGAHLGTRRRTVYACWHAHRDAIRAIFRATPDALLITKLARYEGSNGFKHEFPMTGTQNVGSLVQPRNRQDCCECNENIGDY